MNASVQTVTSKDGTTIAYDKLGSGPPVVLVCGGSTDRMANAGLAALLSSSFTVFNFDRRGRGDSGDTLPYAVEREIEDIDAVVGAAGGKAGLYGTSSGAALALWAADQLGDRIAALALWEPPFILDPNARPPADQVEQYNTMIREGRRGDAVEYFMARVVGMPPDFVAFARTQPFWEGQERIAHTLAYDATIMGDYSLPVDRAARVETPTMVLVGEASFPFMHQSAEALARALPNSQVRTLAGQEHNVAPESIAPVLTEFWRGAGAA